MVSNSVRHGGATDLTVSLAPWEQSSIRVEVRDNGLAVGETTRSGRGTRLVTECTLVWSLTPIPEGQLLAVVLPAQATPDLVGERAPR